MEQNILSKFDMSGRTVLVTGAGGLLGKQFSLALAQAGASVMLADLAEDLAQAQAEFIRAQGLTAEAVAVDVIDPLST
ncbi:MAG: SDR family NAD(P)-dependent oxidoreductase, partial [Anaerolineaceae bacterium]|nr:SDR family NAD(P)-dependent oxidoreductase [Anaerolineaceae bacterium]